MTCTTLFLWVSISANSEHGLPRTNRDKRRAVNLEWNDWEIARRCQVTNSFVSRLPRRLSVLGEQMRPRKVKRGDTGPWSQCGMSGRLPGAARWATHS